MQSETAEISPPKEDICAPNSWALGLETIVALETEAMLDKASPLNPKEQMLSRSLREDILLVACGKKAFLSSDFSMP